MAVTIEERVNSRRKIEGENPSVELTYALTGSSDDAEVITELKNTAPATFDGLPIRSYEIEPQDSDSVWTGRVRYGRPSTSNRYFGVGESSFAFSTGGGREHITQALATTVYPAGAADFKGAIGVTRDSVQGVDITVPVYQFSETHYLADSTVDDTYKANLFSLTGKVNTAAFKNFAAGELLFLGAQGSKRGDDDWEITFSFAASPNKTNLTVGDVTGINKAGWQYLEVYYDDVEDAVGGRTVKQPAFVRVHDVYDTGSFALLGI